MRKKTVSEKQEKSRLKFLPYSRTRDRRRTKRDDIVTNDPKNSNKS